MSLSSKEWAAVWRRAIAGLSPQTRAGLAKCKGRQSALAVAGAIATHQRCQALLGALLDEALAAAEHCTEVFAIVGATVLSQSLTTHGEPK